jgi:RNA 3'-terminal phosphate cyclase (ATP)
MDLGMADAFRQATGAAVHTELGSEQLTFAPSHPIRALRARIDLSSFANRSHSGSAVLLVQTLLAPLARAGAVSELSILGGTHIPYAPTYDYFHLVTIPAMRRLGIYAAPSIQTAGYSNGGTGELNVEIEPSALQPFDFSSPGQVQSLKCCITTSELSDAVGKRAIKHVGTLAHKDGLSIRTEFVKVRSESPGAAVSFGAVLKSGFGGTQSIGEKGRRMEEVVEDAYYAFVHWLNGSSGVDEFLADQLIVPAVLCGEPCAFSTPRVTKTLLSTAWVVKQFMPAKITILGSEGEPGEVKVHADL